MCSCWQVPSWLSKGSEEGDDWRGVGVKWRGWWGGRHFPHGFDLLTNQKFPPMVLFFGIHFLPTNTKVCLMYTNFKGGARLKNVFFWSNFSKKWQNTAFLTCFFFKNLPRAQEYWSNWVFIVFWERSDNQFGQAKKNSTEYSRNFWTPTPLEYRHEQRAPIIGLWEILFTIKILFLASLS